MEMEERWGVVVQPAQPSIRRTLAHNIASSYSFFFFFFFLLLSFRVRCRVGKASVSQITLVPGRTTPRKKKGRKNHILLFAQKCFLWAARSQAWGRRRASMRCLPNILVAPSSHRPFFFISLVIFLSFFFFFLFFSPACTCTDDDKWIIENRQK
ncbi:hypothetical protein AA313_de0200020 [Arthrobotrys entomopaga]|nr:hypothetical protein AA313_de0200020 [Arthrobotrys entomopaga]